MIPCRDAEHSLDHYLGIYLDSLAVHQALPKVVSAEDAVQRIVPVHTIRVES